MSEPIISTYEGVEIVLLEDENVWRFTVNGRTRKADSLPKAREAIERSLYAVEKKQEAKFEPISVYYLNRYVSDGDIRGLAKGRITSITDEKDYDGVVKVWATTERRGREKRGANDFCLDTPENVAVFEELKAIQTEIDVLKEQLRKRGEAIQRLDLQKAQAASENMGASPQR